MEGFDRQVCYFKILITQTGMKVDVVNDGVIVSSEMQYSVGCSASVMSVLLHICSINYQEKLVPAKVTLWHPEPEDTSKNTIYSKRFW